MVTTKAITSTKGCALGKSIRRYKNKIMKIEANVAVYATPREMEIAFEALRLMNSDTIQVGDEKVTVASLSKALTGLLNQHGGCDSLNVTVGDSDTEIEVEDRVAQDAFKDAENKHLIADVMRKANLTAKQDHMLRLYYGLNGDDSHSLQELADLHDCSKKAVHKVIEAAHRKMQKVGVQV